MTARTLRAQRIRQGLKLIVFAFGLPACAQTERVDTPPQIRAFTEENIALCKDAGGTPTLSEYYLTEVGDLNGDGRPDFVTNLAGLDCAGAWTLFCGSAGCLVNVWLSGKEEYFVGWGGHAQAWEMRGKEFVVSLHGQLCSPPRVGAESCELPVRFD